MRFRRLLLAAGFLLLLLVLIMIPLHTARAAGGSLTASSTNIEVGQTVTLTVTVSGSDIAGFQGTLSTGATVAALLSSTDTATFTPSSPGTYNIYASGYIAHSDQSTENFTTNTVTITVREPEPDPTPTPTPTPTATPTATPASTPTQTQKPGSTPNPDATEPPAKTPIPEEGDKPTPTPTEDARPFIRTSDGDIYVALELPKDTVIPSGSKKGSVVIKNRYVEAFSLGGDDIYIVYTTNKAGENGQFRVYSAETETFMKPVAAAMPAKNYQLFSLSSNLTAPDGFSHASVVIGGETIHALKDLNNDGFYLVLAQDETGQLDYYLYDETNQTLQRYTAQNGQIQTSLPTPEPKPSQTQVVLGAVEELPAKGAVNIWKIVAIIGMLCSICLLGALSVVLFVNRKKNSGAAEADAAVMKDLLEEENNDLDFDSSTVTSKESISGFDDFDDIDIFAESGTDGSEEDFFSKQ